MCYSLLVHDIYDPINDIFKDDFCWKATIIMPKSPSSHLQQRQKTVRLKTARGRKTSSQRWLSRQLNDPYVQEARARSYRSRAAFKLIQINEKFKILKPGLDVVDLGAAPGGWSQIAWDFVQPTGKVAGIDLLPIVPLSPIVFLQGDFYDLELRNALKTAINGSAHVVLSDMAASTTGHRDTDHIRTKALGDLAFQFSKGILKDGGTFVAKVFEGGTHPELLNELKKYFRTVKHFKPPASRKESPEMYVVCLGFRHISPGKEDFCVPYDNRHEGP
jgi:23S rRNA (uridine2552-2'-O)-methyltransferase